MQCTGAANWGKSRLFLLNQARLQLGAEGNSCVFAGGNEGGTNFGGGGQVFGFPEALHVARQVCQVQTAKLASGRFEAVSGAENGVGVFFLEAGQELRFELVAFVNEEGDNLGDCLHVSGEDVTKIGPRCVVNACHQCDQAGRGLELKHLHGTLPRTTDAGALRQALWTQWAAHGDFLDI
jgi:hypothetical protein